MKICPAVRFRAAALLTGGLLLSSPAPAQLLEIIHTNDLHSHLDHAENPAQGGYAAVKGVIDRLRAEARAGNADTLVLDAGDFTEGSQYYLADRGAEAWRAMDAMGYDAVTIGNHDWFEGLAELDDVVARAIPHFPLLGANFIFDSSRAHLARTMRPYIELEKAGSRVAVLGLTTDNIEYSWMVSPGFINDPVAEARARLKELRGRDDFVIALTHLGVDDDVKVARTTSGIDLVVGGHSHTMLIQPIGARDQRGRVVPIVQTGKHGEYVGDLLVDLVPGQPLRIVHYRLVPVYSGVGQDPVVAATVRDARDELDREYGASWLRETVGQSEIPLENTWETGRPSVWGHFVAEAMQETAGAELAVDPGEFTGPSQPAGAISREELFVLYPRIFDVNHRYGFTVWRSTARGWILKIILKQVIQRWIALNTAGVTYSLASDHTASDFKVGGDDMHWWRNYDVAVPEGVLKAAYGISGLLHLILKSPHDSQVPVWFATERHLREVGGVIHAPQPQRRPRP